MASRKTGARTAQSHEGASDENRIGVREALDLPETKLRLSITALRALMEEHLCNPALLIYTAKNMPGLRCVIDEIVRNAYAEDHGNAKQIDIRVGVGPTLSFTDDGVGLDAEARTACGTRLGRRGKKKAAGTGSGARLSAATICQIMEIITISKDEPGVAYRIVLNLPRFIVTTMCNIREVEWERVRPEDTPLPAGFAQGAMVILRDFRACDADDPLDATKFRDTSHLITSEEVQRIVPLVLEPSITSLVRIDGRSVTQPVIEGFKLWSSRTRVVPGLGRVSGDLRYTQEREGRRCTIGGTTRSVSFEKFLDGFREHNPDLARRLRGEFFDKHLGGWLILDALERFPTQSRACFDPSFYSTPEAAAAVSFMNEEIAPAISAGIAAYDRIPATEALNQSLFRMFAAAHQRQGIAPGTIFGTGPEEDPSEQPLEINRDTVKLEQYHPGDDRRDHDVFRILNPIPGETFTWDDYSTGVLDATGRSRSGDEAPAHAIETEGRYPVDVQSDQYAKRRQRLIVEVGPPKTRRTDPNAFRLTPSVTQMRKGQVKRIGVARAGKTSGMGYVWSATRQRGDAKESIRSFTVLEGSREIDFRPLVAGDYIITCSDPRHPEIDPATSRVAVLETRDETITPPTSGTGTGTKDEPRGSAVDARLVFSYRGTAFRIRGAPFLGAQPWDLESKAQEISISDTHTYMTHARTPEERDRHLSWCLAAAIGQYQVMEGQITAEDTLGLAMVHKDVIELLDTSVSLKGPSPSKAK